MDLLFNYKEEKKIKSRNKAGACDLSLFEDGDKLILETKFDFYYHTLNLEKNLVYNYVLIIDTSTGDITTINNNKKVSNKTEIKVNDFFYIDEHIKRGLIFGESNYRFWGAKYLNATKKITAIVKKKLKPIFKHSYHENITYFYPYSELYKLIVDFYLDYREIKPHDDIYFHIKQLIPKKKWLKKNENKFLPAALDSLGIKTKYFISELNNKRERINLITLKNLCNILDYNHIDYIKNIPWKELCDRNTVKLNKGIKFKNDAEKNNFVRLANMWKNNEVSFVNRDDEFLNRIFNILSIRYQIEKNEIKDFNLIFKTKNFIELEIIENTWSGLKNYIKKGYKLKYDYSKEMINDIEQTVIVNDLKFKIKVLKTEDDFILEGIRMKNCLSRQFNNGIFMIFLSMVYDRKKINISYNAGKIYQCFGKANTTAPDLFKPAIEILNEKMKKYNNISWKKVKYDIIN
jgi:hypothetical protein